MSGKAAMRIRTAGRHSARHSENGMPKESIALRGGRCDSPMVLKLEARSSTVCSLRLYGRLCGQTCDSRHYTTRAFTGQTYSGSKKVYASKEVKAMPCRICIQLE